MNILAFDPSSTVTGYAQLRQPDRGRLLLDDAGLLHPAASDPPLRRAEAMAREAVHLVYAAQPDVVLVEITSGKVNRHRHKGGGAGLAVYGMAVGVIWAEVRRAFPAARAIPENTWTRGVSKRTRATAVAAAFPRYQAAGDPGLDAADAIGLAWWYVLEQAPGTARAEVPA